MYVPCKDCIDRKVGCHSTCENYKKFQEISEHIKTQRNKEKETRTLKEAKTPSRRVMSKFRKKKGF